MSLDAQLLVGSTVLLVAVLAARWGSRVGLPSLLLFLLLGVLMQPFGFDLQDALLAHELGFAALVFILAEGGFTTRWADIRRSLGLAGLLATLGVGVSIAVVAAFTHYLLGLPWPAAVLMGAITAPTDSAAVFSVLRDVPLPSRLRGTLEAESGFNDAPTVLLVAMATAWSLGDLPDGGPLVLGGLILAELAGGLLLGVTVGYLGAPLLKSVALPSSGLYPLAAMGTAVFAYGLGVLLHVSGFAAVYVCAIFLGNSMLPHRKATRSFAEGVGWIAQIGLFVMLGMLATPSRLTWATVLAGLILGLFVTFVARPLSVWACAAWFRIPWREQAFISWAGLRGAVPIIMATVPLAARTEGAPLLFDTVFIFVVVFTLLQAPTLPWVARKLGVLTADPVDIEVEVAPLEKIQSDFMQIKVPVGSHLAGVSVQELRLPRFTVIAVIVRDEQPIVPNAFVTLREHDELLIVVPSGLRHRVEERFREVGRGGRLAGWLEE